MEKKTRLAQMIAAEQRNREQNDRQAAEAIGASQQTFHAWKRGTIPRPAFRPALAGWLRISPDMMDELCDEAVDSKGTTKLPKLGLAREYGRVSDRKSGMFKFEPVNAGRKAIPEGRYSVVVDTKIMEPAFRVGCKVWLDPGAWPAVGDDVIVHSDGGRAWIGRLASWGGDEATLERYAGEPVTVKPVRAVHVVTVAARRADA